ncbi:MAG: hypothetical protein JST80_01515 [Bdellovibrionales bacterium]|nr:hypothetical protein [Bdellovibrionales bacterium]
MKHIGLVVYCISLIVSNAFAQTIRPETPKTKLDTNREVVRTYARIYLEQKDFAKAENMLTEYLAGEAADGNLWNLLGLTQMEERKYSQACYAFQKATNTFTQAEDQIYAMYNFADCLNRGARSQEARAVLIKLKERENGLSDSASSAIQLMDVGLVPPGSPLPPYRRHGRGQWRLSAAIGSGFDSNVLLVEEAVAAQTSVSDRGSFFITPAFQIGYLGRAFGKNFDSRYLMSFTDYLNQNAANFNTMFNRLDFLLNDGDDRYGLFTDIMLMNRSPFQLYNYDAGFTWMRVHVIDDYRAVIYELPVRYQKYLLDANTSADNDRTGFDAQGKVSYRLIYSDLESLTLQTIGEVQYSTGKNYRLGAVRVPATWITKLPFFYSSLGLLNTIAAEVDGVYYFNNDYSRKDLFAKGSFGVTKRFGEQWSSSLDYSYQKNFSNVDAAKYSKAVISFAINKEL